MNGRCTRCGGSGRVERHHPTGRIAGVPIHEVLEVVECVACHLDEGAVWHTAGLESRTPTVAILLRRLAVWLARWPGALPEVLVAALAEVLADLAERLEDGWSS